MSDAPVRTRLIAQELPGADMKNVLILVLAGALVGVIAASYIAPPMLSWYTTPGGLPQGAQVQALVQIPDVIRYATGQLMRAQVIGGGIGAVAGTIGGILLIRRGRVKPPQSQPQPAPTK
jgi:hypothetical protein